MQACCPLASTIGLPVRGDVSTTCSMCELATSGDVFPCTSVRFSVVDCTKTRTDPSTGTMHQRAGSYDLCTIMITVVSWSELAVLPVDTT
jgi:hypothetical protein